MMVMSLRVTNINYNGLHTGQSGKPPDNPVHRAQLTPMPSPSLMRTPQYMPVCESFYNQHLPVSPITWKSPRRLAKPVWQKDYKMDFVNY